MSDLKFCWLLPFAGLEVSLLAHAGPKGTASSNVEALQLRED